MKLQGTLNVAGRTDIGLQRTHNEDAINFDASTGIMVLADGMGGHLAGEVASEIAVLSILADLKYTLKKKFTLFNGQLKPIQLPSSQLHNGQLHKNAEAQKMLTAVNNANSLIYNISQSQPCFTGMATTLLLSVFSKNKVFVGHIGDSRMYRYRHPHLLQMTEDHSIVQAQINAGCITPDQAKLSSSKNLVTRALGLGEDVDVTLNAFEVEADDIYLLCSDGLTDVVEDAAISAVLRQAAPMQVLAENLINLANAQGGRDNVSVILVQVKAVFLQVKKQRLTNAFLNVKSFIKHHF